MIYLKASAYLTYARSFAIARRADEALYDINYIIKVLATPLVGREGLEPSLVAF